VAVRGVSVKNGLGTGNLLMRVRFSFEHLMRMRLVSRGLPNFGHLFSF